MVLLPASGIVTTPAHIAAVAAATPQERAAAAVPALRRGADNEKWCCCQQRYQLRAAWSRYWAAGIWLGLWVGASGGAAQSASIFISILTARTSDFQCHVNTQILLNLFFGLLVLKPLFPGAVELDTASIRGSIKGFGQYLFVLKRMVACGHVASLTSFLGSGR